MTPFRYWWACSASCITRECHQAMNSAFDLTSARPLTTLMLGRGGGSANALRARVHARCVVERARQRQRDNSPRREPGGESELRGHRSSCKPRHRSLLAHHARRELTRAGSRTRSAVTAARTCHRRRQSDGRCHSHCRRRGRRANCRGWCQRWPRTRPARCEPTRAGRIAAPASGRGPPGRRRPCWPAARPPGGAAPPPGRLAPVAPPSAPRPRRRRRAAARWPRSRVRARPATGAAPWRARCAPSPPAAAAAEPSARAPGGLRAAHNRGGPVAATAAAHLARVGPVRRLPALRSEARPRQQALAKQGVLTDDFIQARWHMRR